jgi:hypothetical protein
VVLPGRAQSLRPRADLLALSAALTPRSSTRSDG